MLVKPKQCRIYMRASRMCDVGLCTLRDILSERSQIHHILHFVIEHVQIVN